MSEKLEKKEKRNTCSIGEAALLLCAIGVPNPYYNIDDPAGVVKKSLKTKERLYPNQSEAFHYFRTGNLNVEGIVIYSHQEIVKNPNDEIFDYLDEKIHENKSQMILPL